VSDKTYNALKYIGTILLPSIAVAYNSLAEVWTLPYKIEITNSIIVAITFLNNLLQQSSINYYQQLKDGNSNLLEKETEKKTESETEDQAESTAIEYNVETTVNEYKRKLLAPLKDGGLTKDFSTTHWGIDLGWVNVENANVYSMYDGKVVDVFYSASCGNSVVIQSEENEQHFFHTYIHLHTVPTVNVGDSVKQGQKIGIRGNTGQSNGTHLHVGVTKATSISYNWDNIKSLYYDFKNDLYKDKDEIYSGIFLNSLPNM
jgi:murein DD-endopeptidase MepM/ murein hydrolase activator NlpD